MTDNGTALIPVAPHTSGEVVKIFHPRSKTVPRFLTALFLRFTVAVPALAQGRGGRPATRKHTATEAQPVALVPATEQPRPSRSAQSALRHRPQRRAL